jgi:hypothetical protein
MGTNPGRTYKFYTGAEVMPFGFGLSYTSFTYAVEGMDEVSLAALPNMLTKANENQHGFVKTADAEEAGPATAYFVKVTNTGSLDADDVVLGFLTPPGAGENGVPLKYLFGFERVHVKVGETVTVMLYPAYTDFTSVTLEGKRLANHGEYTATFGVQEGADLGAGFASHTFFTSR